MRDVTQAGPCCTIRVISGYVRRSYFKVPDALGLCMEYNTNLASEYVPIATHWHSVHEIRFHVRPIAVHITVLIAHVPGHLHVVGIMDTVHNSASFPRRYMYTKSYSVISGTYQSLHSIHLYGGTREYAALITHMKVIKIPC